jgi:hypothetical protein
VRDRSSFQFSRSATPLNLQLIAHRGRMLRGMDFRGPAAFWLGNTRLAILELSSPARSQWSIHRPGTLS